MKLGQALAQIKGPTTGSEKTAAVPPSTPATTSIDVAADSLRQAVKEAMTPDPAETKTAALAAPVDDLSKLAADIASTEHEALTKEATFYGAAVADGFMARLAQYQDAAAKLAGQGIVPAPTPTVNKTASADASFEKFAAENPDLVNEAFDLGYQSTKTSLLKLAEAAYVRSYNGTVEQIYKLACDTFVGGFTDTLKLLEAPR